MTLLTLDESFSDFAGAIVWWSLSGPVDIDEVVDAIGVYELPESWKPSPPRMETVARRATAQVAQGQRELVRPLKTRGSFDLIAEQVREDESAGEETLHYHAQVRVKVVEIDDAAETGKKKRKQIVCVPTTSADIETAEKVAAAVPQLSHLLMPNDVSVWLCGILDDLHAVSLRPRGGFYFIPAGPELAQWRRLVQAVTVASHHTMHSIPTVRSDDAIEAVLSAVKHEADRQLALMETYLLDGEPSIRGLRAHMTTTEALQKKLARYAALLGVNLVDFADRAENLLGLLVAAKIQKETKA